MFPFCRTSKFRNWLLSWVPLLHIPVHLGLIRFSLVPKLPVSFLKLTYTSPDIFCISGYVLTAVDILERTGFIPPSLELTGFARCRRKILSAFCLQVWLLLSLADVLDAYWTFDIVNPFRFFFFFLVAVLE